MTTINLHHQVIDVQVSADRAINGLMNAIAKSIGVEGYAEVELFENMWGVYITEDNEKMKWIPGTVSGKMLPIATLELAYLTKGWRTTVTGDTIRIDYPEITTVVEEDDDD